MKQYWEIDGWFGEDLRHVYDYVIERTPSGGSFVELGAWLGSSTAYLVDNTKDIDITVIDSWKGSNSEIDTNHKLAKTENVLELFLENMGDRKFNYHQGLAEELVHNFEDESIDTVLIDLDHSYESVYRDISLWLPKVKKGGILAGDDYREAFPGVRKAVYELIPESLIYHYGWIYFKK